MAAVQVPEPVRPIDRIVVPVEGTADELVAQQWAVEFAAALELPLRAVHISMRPGDSPPDVFAYLESLCKKWHVTLETRTVRGQSVVDELVEELAPRDLVVLGTRKLASHYHVGSVAEDLVRRAPCPVQIVRLV